MTTRDPAISPRAGDIWKDLHGVTMTVIFFHVGHLMTLDKIVVNVAHGNWSGAIELDYDQFTSLVRSCNLIRVDGERRHL